MRIANMVSALVGLTCLSLTAVQAEEGLSGGLGQPSPEYLAQRAELEKMLSSRDLETFEVTFEALALDRILLKDALGNPHLFHYLAFRVRNKTSSGGALVSQAKGYNDVLAAIAAQYEQAKVDKGNGVALAVETADPKDGVIIERRDAHSAERSLDLSVLASNEHGTRISLLDDPIGSGAQESFNFPDLGQPKQGTPSQYVRDRVEEALGRKLLTVDEIRALKLPPYDATKLGDNGWAAGEVYGVVIFNRLSDYGKHITIQIRGLSNKFRERWPEAEQGKVENYLEARFFRREFVLHYEYPGDEYFRDQDRFELARAGWEWIPTFQRNTQRRAIAYSRYYLNNIASDKGDTLNKGVEDEFWSMYNEVRGRKADKLPDLQAEIKATP